MISLAVDYYLYGYSYVKKPLNFLKVLVKRSRNTKTQFTSKNT